MVLVNLHSFTYLQIVQLKHCSVTFSHFLLIDLYIGSFQSMKYSYFHVELYYNFQSQRTLHFLKISEMLRNHLKHLNNHASTCVAKGM